jgi:hypothetical protein
MSGWGKTNKKRNYKKGKNLKEKGRKIKISGSRT